MGMIELRIDQLTFDPEVLPRPEAVQSVVDQYAEDLKNGAIFPPISVVWDGPNYWVYDGNMRIQARIKNKESTVLADIIEGTRRDAILLSFSANADHGKRRTNKEKRAVVIKCLCDEEWGKWSAGVIAGICMVTQPFVSNRKKKLTQNGFEFPKLTMGKDGIVRDTENIGKLPSPKNPGPSDPEDLELAEDQDQDPDDVAKPPETESDGEDLDIDLEDDPDAEETDPEAENSDADSGDAVDTDTEGDVSGDDDTDSEEQDLDLEETGDDEDDPDISDLDEIDLEDAVDVDTEGEAPGDNTDAEEQDLNLDGSDGDEEDLDPDDTTDPENTEIDPDLVLDENDLDTDAVDTDTEGDASGDDNTDAEAQDLNLEETGNEDNDLDSGETTEPGAGETDPETDLDLEKVDPPAVTTPPTVPTPPAEGTGDNDQEPSDLDGIEDIDTLKLFVAHLKKVNKEQEEELEIKNDYIAELKQEMEDLEEKVLALEEQLEARVNLETSVSASLDIDPMDAEYAYSLT